MANMGIGDRVRELFTTTDLDSHGVLAVIQREFPQANTKIASIQWYKSKINTGKGFGRARAQGQAPRQGSGLVKRAGAEWIPTVEEAQALLTRAQAHATAQEAKRLALEE
jgi:hypothetical protein